MNQAIAQPYPIQLYIPFSKIDAETGIVEGFSTADMNDLQGERVPLAVAKAAFEEAFTRNGGPGVHEMHLPKVVGTFKQWWEEETPDGIPGIMSRVQLSQSTDGRDCFLKVQEGALKGFSIGGRGPSFHFDPDGTKVYDKIRIDEVSLVDVPACPVAKFTLAKFIEPSEPEELRKDFSCQERFTALEEALCDQAEDVVYVCDFGADWVIYVTPCCEQTDGRVYRRATYAVDTAGTITFSDAEEITPEITYVPATQTEDDLLFGKVVIPHKAGAPLTAPKGRPHGQNADNYGDPNNYAWPIDSKGRVRSAMARYNAGAGKATYQAPEWVTIGNRIAAKASSYFGKPYAVTAGKIQPKDTGTKKGVRTMDFKKALELAMILQKGDMSGGLSAILALLESKDTDAVDQAIAALQVMLSTIGSSSSSSSPSSSSSTDGSSSSSTPSSSSSTSTPSFTRPRSPMPHLLNPGLYPHHMRFPTP